MTPTEFVANFGPAYDIPVMSSCLEDTACTHCGGRFHIRVSVSTFCALSDDGTEDVGDHEYDNGSAAYCANCQYGGQLSDFIIEGLDDYLRELNPQQDND